MPEFEENEYILFKGFKLLKESFLCTSKLCALALASLSELLASLSSQLGLSFWELQYNLQIAYYCRLLLGLALAHGIRTEL